MPKFFDLGKEVAHPSLGASLDSSPLYRKKGGGSNRLILLALFRLTFEVTAAMVKVATEYGFVAPWLGELGSAGLRGRPLSSTLQPDLGNTSVGKRIGA